MPRKTPDGPSIYPNCGTRSAYYRHLSNKTQTCRPCKNAAAAAMDKYRHENGINKARFIPDEVIAQHGIKVKA
jgi:hypothetical protein